MELLAPAKNIDVARAAIMAGADAIYIGAPQSEPSSAGISIFPNLYSVSEAADVADCVDPPELPHPVSDAAKSAAARKIDNTFFLIVLSPVNHLQNKLKFLFLDDNIT